MLMSIGDLVADMQKEDPGVTASVFSQGESARAGLMTFLTPIKPLRCDLVQRVVEGEEQQRTLMQLSLIWESKKNTNIWNELNELGNEM